MPTRGLVRVAAWLASAAAVLGCSGERETTGGPDWRAAVDTVGDTVVVRTESGSVWGDTSRLVPEVTIGELEGADEYMFGRIASLAVAPDGSIYVFDSHAMALRKYAPVGAYLATFGREGGGPGEYRRPDGDDDTWVMATIDGPSLDAASHVALQLLPPNEAPDLLTDLNGATGWMSTDATPFGTKVRGEDLMKLVRLAGDHGGDDRLDMRALQRLLGFLEDAVQQGRQLRIADD